MSQGLDGVTRGIYYSGKSNFGRIYLTAANTFATAINCMDGRVQVPVMEFLKRKYGVNYVDMITEPGHDGILAANKDQQVIDLIRKRVDISTEKHGSRYIAIVGHHDCAGNPVDRNTHIEHIRRAIETVKSWGVKAEIIGLWVNDEWKVSEVE
jgi:carbonic anhydrase